MSGQATRLLHSKLPHIFMIRWWAAAHVGLVFGIRLYYDLVDRQFGIGLAMTSLSAITYLRLILEYGHLPLLALAYNGSLDFDSIEGRLTHGDPFPISNEENLIQFNRSAFIPRELFYIDNLAC